MACGAAVFVHPQPPETAGGGAASYAIASVDRSPGDIGRPEDNGLPPVSDTRYLNLPPAIANDNTQSLGIAIAANGNVIVGWEDDVYDGGQPILSLQAVWTLLDPNGVSIVPDTQCTSFYLASLGYPSSVTSRFLSYFRGDGSAVYGGAAWGPKLKANLFGDGVGMGATSYGLSLEIAEVAYWDDWNLGDTPCVQLLDNAGQPSGILMGVAAAYATSDDGNIRIADWDCLSSGNIVIASESRQNGDLVSLYGGETGATHVVFRILTAAGAELKSETLAGEVPVSTEAWHGVGVIQNGFGMRLATPDGVAVRLFNNDGNPTSTNILLATLTGEPAAGEGGRGEGAGFHGNGKDAYVAVCGSGATVQVTVLNADGTPRYTRSVADDIRLETLGGTDAALSVSGEVLVVFSGTYEGGPVDGDGNGVPLVFGRLLDAAGDPLGHTFFVSENETPQRNPSEAQNPRVAWRDSRIVVAWESRNSGVAVDLDGDGVFTPLKTVATRFFQAPGSVTPITITGIADNGPTVTLSWSGGSGPYTVQKKTSLSAAAWSDVATTADRQATVPKEGSASFFRVQD